MKIAVIGVGTAGIMSLCHSLRWLTGNNNTVTAIYDPTIKILGIGESADPGFPTLLYEGTGFTLLEDADELDATLKLGVTWKGWRENDFNVLMHPPYYAMHFNNFRLQEFAFSRFEKMWGDKFKILEGCVNGLENRGSKAVVDVDGKEHFFDYVIDCRGFPEDYTDFNVIDVPVNHCLVNVINEPGTWQTTVNQATENGWMFGIPLKTRQGWGYLYNDKITSREDAVKDIEKIFNVVNPKLNEFQFVSYYAKQFFDGRILKNGNRALFFEPIEALSGFFYNTVLRNLFDYIQGHCAIEDVNGRLTEAAKDIENFIHYAYHGGSTFDTEFWKVTTTKSKNKLDNDQHWQRTVNEIRSCFKDGNIIQEKTIARWYVRHWQNWEKNLGYNYFE